jgi:hypothetical protein
VAPSWQLFCLMGAIFPSISGRIFLHSTITIEDLALNSEASARIYKLYSRSYRMVMANVPTNSFSTFSFQLSGPASISRFGPRLGKAFLKRNDGSPAIEMDTPGSLTTTSRGVIPHLSRDHHRLTKAIRWVSVPFETL